MRIAGGRWRGREVLMPKSEAVRPTQSRVREAVFDLLMQVVGGSRFLDLFAGSGAMGLEALSRGAASATFWERDRAVFATLQKNLAAFGVEPTCAIQRDSLLALGLGGDERTADKSEQSEELCHRGQRTARDRQPGGPGTSAAPARPSLSPSRQRTVDCRLSTVDFSSSPFSIIFADPPYRWAQANGLAPLAQALCEWGLLAPGGFFVAEMGRTTHPEEIPGLELVRDRLYGTSRIAIWRRAADEAGAQANG
ncbi:MAG: RsmD family RNA methyltransferase [Candidatus Spyradenecus sp.]